jgi:hypothetical protein
MMKFRRLVIRHRLGTFKGSLEELGEKLGAGFAAMAENREAFGVLREAPPGNSSLMDPKLTWILRQLAIMDGQK